MPTAPLVHSATQLAGQVAIVTGGARGIGRAIAERLLEAGARVVVCGRSRPDALPAASRGDAGGDAADRADWIEADVRSREDVERLVEGTAARLGRLDLLVNNAGGSPPADSATASPRFAEAIVALNLLAPLHLAQRANAVMQSQPDGGAIVNIASVSGLRPSPGTAAYGAAKAGLLHLTQSLAIEWAPRVRVNAVTPGLIHTDSSHLHYGDADGLAAVARTVPLGRLGAPRDVAEAVLFLASPQASWVSGANLVVHGGGERPAFLDAARATR